MATEIKLPNLGEDIESGDVLSILVREGDQVNVDDDLMEIETDKATLPVPSPEAGRISQIHVSEGDTVSVGTVILTLEPTGVGSSGASPERTGPAGDHESQEEKPSAEQEAAKQEAKEEPSDEAPSDSNGASPAKKQEAPAQAGATAPATATEERTQPESDQSRPAAGAKAPPAPEDSPAVHEEDVPGDGHASAPAGPAVRRLARELGVDLRRVRPTGEGGRITREDVQHYVRQANQRAEDVAATQAAGAAVPPGEPSTDGYGPVRRERMSRMRQTIAQNMLHSYSTIPQLTNFDDSDVTELEKIRQESKADYAANGIKLTTMPFLIKAVASALKHHPVINASIDPESTDVIYKEYVNIGVAVDTDRGLVVPVLRDVDRMNIPQIAHAVAKLADMARSGKYAIDDLRGGTFTISNLGAIGGTYSTPIINPPEVAILLAGRSRKLPVYVEDQLQPRLMMPLSITYDHRVVDGAAAARFLNDVKGYLSAPGRLLLAP